MKALIIGRHEVEADAYEKFGVEVAGQINIVFPADPEEIDLAAIYNAARDVGADAVLFQAIPVQLTARLTYEAARNGETGQEIPVYAVVNEPRPDLRKEPAVREFVFSDMYDAGEAEAAAKFANPRAKFEMTPSGFIVTVEQPMPWQPVRLVQIL